MKRNIPYRIATAACAAVCWLMLLTGCAGGGRPVLWYQDAFTSAALTEGGRTWTLAPSPDGFTVRLDAPPPAAGVTFTVTDSGAFASAGGVTIPVTDAMLTGARRLTALFTLREEELFELSASHGEGESAAARYRTAAGEITAVLGADGTPLYFDDPSGRVTVERLEFPPDETNGNRGES